MIQILTAELFGKSMPIDDISPVRPDIVGIGMSCWEVYANRLAHKIKYINTYYHQEPFLDITNIGEKWIHQLDFIVSTDVFEHVAPPISTAFENARRLLKRNGVFIISVPFDRPGEPNTETKEWFPNLYDWKLEEVDGNWILHNTTRDGKQERFDNLCFHGGPGTTLEMRLFSEASLIRELIAAGFNDITIYSKPHLDLGIHWPNGCSIPIAARVVPERRFFFKRKKRPPVVRTA
ncbi:class I SAM-dependent methyltransferase [Achromobacter ruhlandii]|uniref:class I SAM-dependent methyltransferase n=1 Tax=Achromobacter ruhlandii TaxID=72557 RepID=UPI001EEDBC64|nr:methyltransferase domain-containing protein [Achromobacter ruhlandii]